jgi:regulator of protease activity HflC (stomatin/prohibitin superfamily)
VQPLVQLLIVAVLIAIILTAVRLVHVVTVHDYERGLRFSRGRLTGLTGSGSHLSFGSLSEIRVMDARPTALVLEGQEVMTADGVPVKVSLAARYLVSDPVAAVNGDADYRRASYLMLQLVLRDALAGRTLDQALATRREIGPQVREACAPELAALGVELLAVEVRDMMLPNDLKRAFTGVIAARK